MARRMLIDASHPEETRVVIVSGNRLEEFDYETASKQQIKGNIYLAKVTRVEPSLQAAFVDYGGNRHGFLAFNEIHPDYYRIPIADREKLFGPDSDADYNGAPGETPAERALADADGEAVSIEAMPDAEAAGNGSDDRNGPDDREGADDAGRGNGADGGDGDGSYREARDRDRDRGDRGEDGAQNVESMGGDDDEEIDRERRRLRLLRNYRIQEVIKRRQIMLVQVTKEERGNKGAALTTYLSLAGRYCVLMPNTARGGGVSRKISNPADRKRLRVILDDLEIPEGMAVIVRTAGSERSRAEIKRDYEYLMRLWEQIRQTTLESVSPALIHEEGNLIKRSIRDLYSRDIDEVIVDGEVAYRTAKDFMRMLMPSHAARVKRYKEDVVPLFQQYQVESQLDEIHSNTVRLKSGGYLVINPTEALVSIDVNSGRATRERHIEETALKTNLEAAQEVSRQLRLRDLAGLIVIDFIDMEEHRNNTAVERKLKESLRGDRARIQLGRISAFGLLEMSRQRLRPSIIEASSQVCPHCNGAGHIRSTESSALQALRGIEEEGLSRRSSAIQVYVPSGIALYLLNQKRGAIIACEQRYDFSVAIATDDTLIAPDFQVERLVERSAAEVSELRGADAAARTADDEVEDVEEVEEIEEEEEERERAPVRAREDGRARRGDGRRRADRDADRRGDDARGDDGRGDDARESRDPESRGAEARGGDDDGKGEDGKGRPRRRRSRRRRGGRREDGTPLPAAAGEELPPEADGEEPVAAEDGDEAPALAAEGDEAPGGDDGQQAKSRRGRRGGRRRRRRDDAPADAEAPAAEAAAGFGEAGDAAAVEDTAAAVPEAAVDGAAIDGDGGYDDRELAAGAPDVPASAPAEPEPLAPAPEPIASAPAEPPAPSAAEPVVQAMAETGNGHAPASGNEPAPPVEQAREERADRAPVSVHADAGAEAGDEPRPGAPRREQPRRGWWQRLIEG